MEPKSIESYKKEDGSCPFEEWESLQSVQGQLKIRMRLNRVAQGNLGNVNTVGNGVHELKFQPKSHPCYRVYFANDGKELILLLCGGDKSNQQGDIEKAKEYWDDYKKRK